MLALTKFGLLGGQRAAGPFAGAGDAVAGGSFYWGLRSYTLASIGANAIRLREDGGSTESDFATIAGGGLDLSAITTFKGANNLFVAKVYDQISTNHLVQATAGLQPQFILSGLGAKPVVRFVGGDFLQSVSNITQAQPFTIPLFAARTSSFGGTDTAVAASDGSIQHGFAGANLAFMFNSGAVVTAAALDSVFHALQLVNNGASSDLNVDGSTNTLSPGTAGIGVAFVWGSNSGNNFSGDSTEAAFYVGAFSGANSTAMSLNQHAYWG